MLVTIGLDIISSRLSLLLRNSSSPHLIIAASNHHSFSLVLYVYLYLSFCKAPLQVSVNCLESGRMLRVTYSEDAALPHLTESSTEEHDHEKNGVERELCRRLRLPNPEYFSVEYRDLKDAAGKGCELCDLLQEVSETAASTIGQSIWEYSRVQVIPRGRAVLVEVPRLSIPQWEWGTRTGRDLRTSQLAQRTNAIGPFLLTIQPLFTDTFILHPVGTFLLPKETSPRREYRVDVL